MKDSMTIRTICGAFAAFILVVSGCTREPFVDVADGTESEKVRLSLSGSIVQVYQTRANDSGFADGDRIGIYVVDYDGAEPGALKLSGNRADNVWFKFKESAGRWDSARDIYWKDKKTHVDIYGYYPFTSVEDIGSLTFEVRKDQSAEARGGELAGYEASDFLWGQG